MRSQALIVPIIAIYAGNAAGQGVGAWMWDVATPDGDSLVEPGELATVTLSLDLMPSVGDQQDDGEFVIAFGGSEDLDILGGINADKGEILFWEANPFLWLGGGSDGVNITDILLFQFPQGPTDYSDPIELVSFVWKPDVYEPFQVTYQAQSLHQGQAGVLVWETFGQQSLHGETWQVTTTSGEFAVVPAPAASAVLLVTSLASRRRRHVR